jgi:hypothetical protein
MIILIVHIADTTKLKKYGKLNSLKGDYIRIKKYRSVFHNYFFVVA